MHTGVLIKKSSTHDKLRTDSIFGVFTRFPVVTTQFHMVSSPIDSTKNFRFITTSEIQEVSTDGREGVFKFKTLNSEYELRVLDTISSED